MSVRKLSVALDESIAASASRAAQTAGVSLSARLSRAAVHELALERGRRAVVAWEREHGALTPEELRDADDCSVGSFPPVRGRVEPNVPPGER
jgi:hypothetical protein